MSDIFSHALKPAGKFTPRSPRSHCSPLASSETNIALHMAEQSTSASSRHVARTLRDAWRLSLLRFEAHSDVCSRLEVPSLCVCARMPGLLMACSLESLASGPTRDADRVGRLPPSRPGMQLQRGAFGKTLKFSQPKRQPRRIERWGNFNVVRPKLGIGTSVAQQSTDESSAYLLSKKMEEAAARPISHSAAWAIPLVSGLALGSQDLEDTLACLHPLHTTSNRLPHPFL